MLIDLKNISLTIADHQLLKGINFQADEGEFIYLVGKVGTGKSSLLKVLYGEIKPEKGEGDAQILDFNLHTIKRSKLPVLRKQLGIVFQDFQLLSHHTVKENLDFVLRATGWKKRELRTRRIGEVLEDVELSDHSDHYPHQLSGGEQQRVAIARALLNHPKIILADEPTGNLDKDTSDHIINLLRGISERGTTIVMVTHNLNLLQRFPGIVYRCEKGQIIEVTSEYNTPIRLEE